MLSGCKNNLSMNDSSDNLTTIETLQTNVPIKIFHSLNYRYSGHYVVLCGYDLNKRKIKYRNPAKENRKCTFSILVNCITRDDSFRHLRCFI